MVGREQTFYQRLGGSQVTGLVRCQQDPHRLRSIFNSRISIGDIPRSATDPTANREKETEICIKYISSLPCPIWSNAHEKTPTPHQTRKPQTLKEFRLW